MLDAIEPLYSGNLTPSELGSRLGIKMAFQGSSAFANRTGFRNTRDYHGARVVERFRTEWGKDSVKFECRVHERQACVTSDELTRRFGERLEWTSSTPRIYSPGITPPVGIRAVRDTAHMAGESGAQISFSFDCVGVSEVGVVFDRMAGFNPGDDPELADFEIVRAGELFRDALARLAALGCNTDSVESIDVVNVGKPFRLTIRPTNFRSPRARVEYVSVSR